MYLVIVHFSMPDVIELAQCATELKKGLFFQKELIFEPLEERGQTHVPLTTRTRHFHSSSFFLPSYADPENECLNQGMKKQQLHAVAIYRS